jgi:hypothetical protein
VETDVLGKDFGVATPVDICSIIHSLCWLVYLCDMAPYHAEALRLLSIWEQDCKEDIKSVTILAREIKFYKDGGESWK